MLVPCQPMNKPVTPSCRNQGLPHPLIPHSTSHGPFGYTLLPNAPSFGLYVACTGLSWLWVHVINNALLILNCPVSCAVFNHPHNPTVGIPSSSTGWRGGNHNRLAHPMSPNPVSNLFHDITLHPLAFPFSQLTFPVAFLCCSRSLLRCNPCQTLPPLYLHPTHMGLRVPDYPVDQHCGLLIWASDICNTMTVDSWQRVEFCLLHKHTYWTTM